MEEEHKRKTRWDRAHKEYTCADGIKIACKFDAVRARMSKSDAEEAKVLMTFPYGIVKAPEIPVPRNGLWARRDGPPVLVVNETQTSRDATEIIRGGLAKTYTFPPTVSTVKKCAFVCRNTQSVRLNEGLEELYD